MIYAQRLKLVEKEGDSETFFTCHPGSDFVDSEVLRGVNIKSSLSEFYV